MRYHRTSALVVILVAAAVLTACRARVTPGELPAPTVAATPAISSLPSSATPSPEPTRDGRPLQGLLPSDFRGTEAHTFPVGQDMLRRLAAAIGIRRRALEAAYASDHGPAFVQMYALRAAGHDPQELLDALAEVAYSNPPPGSVTVEAGQLGDRQVTIISEPSSASSVGTFYGFVDGGTLIVAQALAEPVAEAAFEELPAG